LLNNNPNNAYMEAANSSLYPLGIINNVNKAMNPSDNARIVRNTSFYGQDFGSYKNIY